MLALWGFRMFSLEEEICGEENTEEENKSHRK
jgi:hypothetical protein